MLLPSMLPLKRLLLTFAVIAGLAVTTSSLRAQNGGPQVVGAPVILATDLSRLNFVPSGVESPWGNHDPAYTNNMRSQHYASNVGPNGNVVGNTGLGAFWWTAASGLVEIPETIGASARTDQGGFAIDVNGRGQVAGTYYPKAHNYPGVPEGDIIDQGFGLYWHSRAFLWSQTQGFIDLGVLPGAAGVVTPGGNVYNLSSAATGINEYGQVTGWVMSALPTSPFAVIRAFLLTATGPNGPTGPGDIGEAIRSLG